MSRSLTSLFTVIILVCMPSLAFTADSPLPTPDQVRELIVTGQPQEALQGIARLLAVKGELAVSLDRSELYMLRGEAQLQLKQSSSALASFALAAKGATDAKQAAVATATETLVQKSPGLLYVPKKRVVPPRDPSTQPINIVSA